MRNVLDVFVHSQYFCTGVREVLTAVPAASERQVYITVFSDTTVCLTFSLRISTRFYIRRYEGERDGVVG